MPSQEISELKIDKTFESMGSLFNQLQFIVDTFSNPKRNCSTAFLAEAMSSLTQIS